MVQDEFKAVIINMAIAAIALTQQFWNDCSVDAIESAPNSASVTMLLMRSQLEVEVEHSGLIPQTPEGALCRMRDNKRAYRNAAVNRLAVLLSRALARLFT